MGTTRREFLAGAAGLVAAMAAGGCASMSSARPLPKLAYVGCYTSKQRNGRGEGIAVHRIDAATGAWTQQQLVKTADNPSWLTLDRSKRFLYAAPRLAPRAAAGRRMASPLSRCNSRATRSCGGEP